MIKRVKPTSSSRRGQTYLKRDHLSKPDKKVLKKLSTDLKGPVGRSGGKISMFQRRRGAKQKYRLIDFKRNKYGVEGVVVAIEYDPVRTSDIALVQYIDGEKRYILAPADLKVGDKVVSGDNVSIRPGNTLKLKNIPIGTAIHNIELYPQAGGKFVRSAGGQALITAKEGNYVDVKVPSGEVRKFLAECFASIGKLGNDDWKLVNLGKAGRSVHMGKRPKVRGKTRSYGHPLSGSYKRRIGRQPVDKWGNLSKGKKTRRRKHTNKYIVKDRRAK